MHNFFSDLTNVRNQSVNVDDQIQQLNKQLHQERLLKLQAVNKLAEIMNRKDWTGKKNKSSATDLRRKEKECRKLQQELTTVSIFSTTLIFIYIFLIVCI